MRSMLGKRILTAVLTICFVLTFALSYYYDENAYLGKYTQIKNANLYLEKRDGDTVFIGGNGKLYSGDFSALLKAHNLKPADLINIILDDGITEVGFETITECDMLETLNLGRGVAYIENGAIHDCPALRFVYIPRGTRRIGKDFAFNCNDVYVVTDGIREELGKLRNISDDHILTEVGSYNDLIEKLPDDGSMIPEALKKWWQ